MWGHVTTRGQAGKVAQAPYLPAGCVILVTPEFQIHIWSLDCHHYLLDLVRDTAVMP